MFITKIIDFTNYELSPRNLEYGERVEEKRFWMAENHEKGKNKTKLYWNSKIIKLNF